MKRESIGYFNRDLSDYSWSNLPPTDQKESPLAQLLDESLPQTNPSPLEQLISPTAETVITSKKVDPSTETIMTPKVDPSAETIMTPKVDPSAKTIVAPEVDPSTKTIVTDNLQLAKSQQNIKERSKLSDYWRQVENSDSESPIFYLDPELLLNSLNQKRLQKNESGPIANDPEQQPLPILMTMPELTDLQQTTTNQELKEALSFLLNFNQTSDNSKFLVSSGKFNRKLYEAQVELSTQKLARYLLSTKPASAQESPQDYKLQQTLITLIKTLNIDPQSTYRGGMKQGLGFSGVRNPELLKLVQRWSDNRLESDTDLENLPLAQPKQLIELQERPSHFHETRPANRFDNSLSKVSSQKQFINTLQEITDLLPSNLISTDLLTQIKNNQLFLQQSFEENPGSIISDHQEQLLLTLKKDLQLLDDSIYLHRETLPSQVLQSIISKIHKLKLLSAFIIEKKILQELQDTQVVPHLFRSKSAIKTERVLESWEKTHTPEQTWVLLADFIGKMNTVFHNKHRLILDLKPGNIGYSENGKPHYVILDVGASYSTETELTINDVAFPATTVFLNPEQIKFFEGQLDASTTIDQEKYLVYHLTISTIVPFFAQLKGIKPSKMAQTKGTEVKGKGYKSLNKQCLPSIFDTQTDITPELFNFLEKCLDDNPQERPSLQELQDTLESYVKNLSPDDLKSPVQNLARDSFHDNPTNVPGLSNDQMPNEVESAFHDNPTNVP